MKGFRKKTVQRAAMFFAACLTGVFLTGCGSTKSEQSAVADSAAMSVNAYDGMEGMTDGGNYAEELEVTEAAGVEGGYVSGYDESGAGQAQKIDSSAANAQSSRKLIRTVRLSVETKEFDKAVSGLEQQVNALDGYIEEMNYSGNSYSDSDSTYSDSISPKPSRSASMTVRIPRAGMDGFLKKVSDLCNVVSRSENVEDVTLTYVDMESHRNVLRAEQERLLTYLENAETMEDIIALEDRISNIRYQLESMESQLRTYDNKVDYSTAYLIIDEVKELTPVAEAAEKTVWERISGGFVGSLKTLGNGLMEFGIWFATILPYLVFWGLFLTIVTAVIVAACRGGKKQKGKQKKTVTLEPPRMQEVQQLQNRATAQSGQTQNEQAQNEQTQNEQTQNGQTQNEQTQNGQTQNSQAQNEQTQGGQQ